MKVARIAASLLAILGILTFGTGVYFMFLRPAMLPEDVRFSGISPELLPAEMLSWLRIVFRTLGTFVAGLGILIMSVAGHLLSARTGVLRWGVVLGVSVAFGGLLVSNIQLESDFLGFVALLFGIAAAVALCLLWSARR